MIQHNKNEQRFVALVDGHEAELTYKVEGPVLVFDHTYVPEALRGQSLAKKLVDFGVAYAQGQNLKIRPVCPYVVKYFEKYSGLVKNVKA